MRRDTKENSIARSAGLVCAMIVALFCVKPLFAQATASVQVSVTVIAPVPVDMIGAAAARELSASGTTATAYHRDEMSGLVRVSYQPSQQLAAVSDRTSTVTLEFAAN